MLGGANSSRGVSRNARMVLRSQRSLLRTSARNRSQRWARNFGFSSRSTRPHSTKPSRVSIGGITAQSMGFGALASAVADAPTAMAAVPIKNARRFIEALPAVRVAERECREWGSRGVLQDCSAAPLMPVPVYERNGKVPSATDGRAIESGVKRSWCREVRGAAKGWLGRRGPSVEEAAAHRVDGRLGPVAHGQLLQDALHVFLDRRLAPAQIGGDLTVGQPGG